MSAMKKILSGLLIASCAALSACVHRDDALRGWGYRGYNANGSLAVEMDYFEYTSKETSVQPPPGFPYPWPNNQRRDGSDPSLNQSSTQILGNPSTGRGVAVTSSGEVFFLRPIGADAQAEAEFQGQQYAVPTPADPIEVEQATRLASANRHGSLALSLESTDVGETITFTFADRWSTLAGVVDPFRYPGLAFSARLVPAKEAGAEPILTIRTTGPRETVIAFAGEAGFTGLHFAGRDWSLDDVRTLTRSPVLRRAVSSILGE
jgi:hypothetical protein